MTRRRLTVLAVVLAVVAFFGLNTWAGLDLRDERLDLTQTGQFTLSDGTKKLLGQLEEPVTLRLYASRSLRDANPYLGTYADRVHDLLETYAARANGKINLEYLDPEPFSPEEDRAVGFGLQALGGDNGESAGYLGLAGSNSTDDVDVLPVLSPDREPFLEYDLTRMVYNLSHPRKPVVAVLSALPLNGDPQSQYRPWAVAEQLKQFFDLRYLGGDIGRLDDDVKALMLVQPQNLSERTLYAIDQFVMRGGKVMAFIDPHSEQQAQSQQQPGMGDTSSDLDRLFAAWGVRLVKDRIVGDPQAARQVVYPSGGRQQVVDYLAWLSIDKPGLAGGDVVTQQLNRVNLASAGILEPREGAATTFEPLVSSSPQAQAMEADKVRTYPDPLGLLRDFQPGDKPLVMAARLTGPVKSAFPGGKPQGDADGPDPLAEAKGPADIVVVADTDLLADRQWLAQQGGFGGGEAVPVADNASFVANALDLLAGSDELIGLRQGAVTVRPFTRVEGIRRAAEQQYRAKEQQLLDKMRDLQGKLASLQPAATAEPGEENSLVSERQRREIDGFRGQLLDTRQQLRDTQLALRQDIESLRDRLRLVNIAAVPVLVAAVALLLALFQRVRYRRRVDAAAG